jgi:hypothetical protein
MQKATLIPLLPIELDVRGAALSLRADGKTFSIESIGNLLTSKHFDLWTENLSQNQRKHLTSVQMALVHRFESEGHVGKVEEESKEFLEHVAACLRIVRPTASRFTAIQVRILQDESWDVFRFTHPQDLPPNTPQSDTLNMIRIQDVKLLSAALPKFMSLWFDSRHNMIRAARYFLTGYTDIQDPIAQILIWTAGIEAIFAGNGEAGSRDTLKRLISSRISEWDIYEDSAYGQLAGASIRVGEIAGDLFKLRAHLVHGGWAPEDWLVKEGRPSLSGRTSYADMLREAAASILRKLLVDWFLDEQIAV